MGLSHKAYLAWPDIALGHVNTGLPLPDSENLPHREELLDPMVSVMKAASSVEQAVQLGADSSSRNQSLSQGSHPPDPSGPYPRIHTANINCPGKIITQNKHVSQRSGMVLQQCILVEKAFQ